MKPIRVAQALGVSPAAVTRWKQAWQKGGEKALAAYGAKFTVLAADERKITQLRVEVLQPTREQA